MPLKLTDEAISSLGREIHAMYHAGATRDEALARLQSRLANGRYERLHPVVRRLFDKATADTLGFMWGPEHCGPKHKVVICDEPGDV